MNMNLFTHGEQPLHHRCRSCDASTAEIQRLRQIIADQDRRIIRDTQRHAEFVDQMGQHLGRLLEAQALLDNELKGGRQ